MQDHVAVAVPVTVAEKKLSNFNVEEKLVSVEKRGARSHNDLLTMWSAT